MPTARGSLEEHYWAHIIVPEVFWECWGWAGTLKPSGYGRLYIKPQDNLPGYPRTHMVDAHRIAWILTHGQAIPAGMTVDHVCHNTDPTCPGGNTCKHRQCTNPEHLALASIAENVARGRKGGPKLKTHCDQGHPMSGDNLYVYSDGEYMQRFCRICRREYGRKYKQQQRKRIKK